MNKFLLALTLSGITQAFAQEVRFDPAFEKKCFKEIHGLKCGSPDGKNEEKFMKCVDKNLSNVGKECQEMHKAIRADTHSHHDH